MLGLASFALLRVGDICCVLNEAVYTLLCWKRPSRVVKVVDSRSGSEAHARQFCPCSYIQHPSVVERVLSVKAANNSDLAVVQRCSVIPSPARRDAGVFDRLEAGGKAARARRWFDVQDHQLGSVPCAAVPA